MTTLFICFACFLFGVMLAVLSLVILPELYNFFYSLWRFPKQGNEDMYDYEAWDDVINGERVKS